MTRASAAQEPSMDEILASIRRIIENGDERLDATAPVPVRPERSATVERLGADREGQPANLVARLMPETQTAFLPGDEDDLAASLRSEIEREGLLEAKASPSEEHEFVLGEGSDGNDVAAPEVPVRTTAGEERQDAPQDPSVSEAPFVAANSDSPRMQDFRTAVLDDLEGGRLEASAALVSGRTGELVGASFDELAKAIREGELRSLEDMAQEMLRPMLQDWLDDNLPKLVERLVREEIERVARGGRR